MKKTISKKQKATPLTKRKKRCVEPIKNKKELKKLLNQIKVSHTSSTYTLLRIYMTKDWSKLGYTSFKDFVEKCLPHESYEAVLSRVTCDEVAFELEGKHAVGKYSMNAMRAIKGFKDGSRVILWQTLKDEAKSTPSGKLTPHWLTASLVEDVIKSLLGGERGEEDDDNQSAIPVEKSSQSSRSRPQKDKPKSEIEINEAEKKSISRCTRSEELQTILEEYDGSRPLAEVISQFSVKNFGPKTLRRMRKELIKGISNKKQSELNTPKAQS
tara:strand:- start:11196 stop:12005 length:810 start_codon:yes stop_codon:yes gene_type:complete